MSIDFNKLYPGGGYYDNDQTPWGMCEKCGSYLHNHGPEYDPEDMRSYEPLICPNCQEQVKAINVRWHAPDGKIFEAHESDKFVTYLESIGETIPAILEPDFDDYDDDDWDDYEPDEYEQALQQCGQDATGFCHDAGTEHCSFHCKIHQWERAAERLKEQDGES